MSEATETLNRAAAIWRDGDDNRSYRSWPGLARELVRLTDAIVQHGYRDDALERLRKEIAAIADPYGDCNLHAWTMLIQASIVITAQRDRDEPERAAQWGVIAGALRGMVLEDIKRLEA